MPDDLVAAFRAAPSGALAGAELMLTRRLRHPAQKVWAALVTPARLEAWMAVEWLGGEAPLQEGGPFHYRFANTDIESVGRVLRLQPPRLFEHSWFENVPPGAVVRWELEPEGTGSRLTLTHRFGGPDDAPRNAAGWTELLRRLEHALDEPGAGPWSPSDWRALRDQYAASLGEAASLDARWVDTAEGQAVRFVRVLDHPVQTVWALLTDPRAMARWMQADMQVEPRVGGRFRAAFHGMQAVGEGEVTAWDPPRRFAFTWPDAVSFTLEPHPAGCRLTLDTRVAPERAADNAAGWHWHLDALQRALLGETVGWEWPRIQALHKIYDATLGAAAP
jgi:uncharacterized protein YndB with AHSA1/START domain